MLPYPLNFVYGKCLCIQVDNISECTATGENRAKKSSLEAGAMLNEAPALFVVFVIELNLHLASPKEQSAKAYE
jgi:hypothetical protein